MEPHRINLKGPWTYEWVSDDHETGEGTGRVHMPVDWVSVLGAVGGTVRWSRRFQRPTRLDSDERVFLGFAGIGGAARVAIGARAIGEVADGAARFDVTDVLEWSNEVHVEITFDPATAEGPGGLHGVVTVEIEPA